MKTFLFIIRNNHWKRHGLHVFSFSTMSTINFYNNFKFNSDNGAEELWVWLELRVRETSLYLISLPNDIVTRHTDEILPPCHSSRYNQIFFLWVSKQLWNHTLYISQFKFIVNKIIKNICKPTADTNFK